jgi:hypothetical protein
MLNLRDLVAFRTVLKSVKNSTNVALHSTNEIAAIGIFPCCLVGRKSVAPSGIDRLWRKVLRFSAKNFLRFSN